MDSTTKLQDTQSIISKIIVTNNVETMDVSGESLCEGELFENYQICTTTYQRRQSEEENKKLSQGGSHLEREAAAYAIWTKM